MFGRALRPDEGGAFILVPSQQEGHIGLAAGPIEGGDVTGDDGTVGNRPADGKALRRDDAVGRHSAKLGQAGSAQLARERGAGALGLRQRHRGVGALKAARLRRQRGAALRDRLVEQPPRERRDGEQHHRSAAGRLAEDRDVAGIAPEGRDIVADPAQGGDLVEQAVIAGGPVGRFRAEPGMRQEAEGADAGS